MADITFVRNFMRERTKLVAFGHPPVEDAENFEQDSQIRHLWYSRDRAAEVSYQDGSEDRLLTAIQALPLECETDLACEALVADWPTQYHCDPNRRNLLHPVSHLIQGHVLEIGAGCGALTGFLAGRADHLLALEGAPVRAKIAATRHQKVQNLLVLEQEFFRFRPLISFDTIVVVGVLEYASLFCGGGPAAASLFLERVLQMLAPGGTLLIAIENQFGLSYIGGLAEDHAGQPWFGVDNRYGSNSFRTFGRRILANLLTDTGFSGQSWYYPFPDYKLPTLILAEEALQSSLVDAGELISQCSPDRRFRPTGPGFAWGLAWKGIAQNGLINELADSFLIAATPAKLPPSTDGGLSWVFSTRRLPKFRKVTLIREQANAVTVVRRRLVQEDRPADTRLWQVLSDEPFQAGRSYLDGLRWLCALGVPDIATFVEWAYDWVSYLKVHAEPTGSLPAEFLDCVPANLIRTPTGELFFYDREWFCDPLPTIEYVVFRGIVDACSRLADVLPPGVAGPYLLTYTVDVMTALGLEANLESLCQAECQLQAAVTGIDHAHYAVELKAKSFQAPVTRPVSAKTEILSARDLVSAYDSLLQAYTHLATLKLQGSLGRMDGLIGYIDGLKPAAHGGPGLFGWAWDRTRGKPADLVVLFLEGAPVAAAPVGTIRSDAARALGANTEAIGFIIPVPTKCSSVTPQNATVVALSEGKMSILAWSLGATLPNGAFVLQA